MVGEAYQYLFSVLLEHFIGVFFFLVGGWEGIFFVQILSYLDVLQSIRKCDY